MPTKAAGPTRRKLLGWLTRYGLGLLLALVVAVVLRIGIFEMLVVCITVVIVFGLTQVVVNWVGKRTS